MDDDNNLDDQDLNEDQDFRSDEGEFEPADDPLEETEADELDLDDEEPREDQAEDTDKDAKTKRATMILAGIVVLLLLIGGVMLATRGSDEEAEQSQNTTTETTTNETNTQEQATANANYLLDTIVYAHADDSDSAKQLYTRPASGGDRTEVSGVTIDGDLVFRDRHRNSDKWIFIQDKELKSIDASGNIETIYTLTDTNRDLVTPRFSLDGSQVAFSEIFSGPSQGQEKPIVKVLDLETKEVVKSIEFGGETPVGVFVIAWDEANQKLYHHQSCYQCDAPRTTVLSTSDGQSISTVIQASEPYSIISEVAVKSDGSSIAWIESSNTGRIDSGVPDSVTSDPEVGVFRVHQTSLQDGSDVVIAELGKDITQTFPFEESSSGLNVGWIETETGQSSPYYSYENKVYQYKDGADDSVLYEGSNPILSVLWASDQEIVVGSAPTPNAFSEPVVNYVKYEDGTAVQVMETTSDTRILGFTFQ